MRRLTLEVLTIWQWGWTCWKGFEIINLKGVSFVLSLTITIRPIHPFHQQCSNHNHNFHYCLLMYQCDFVSLASQNILSFQEISTHIKNTKTPSYISLMNCIEWLIIHCYSKSSFPQMDYQKLYEELPKHPIKWTVSDLEIWLHFIGLSSLYPKFKELSIDGSCIHSLAEEDLRDELSIQSGIIIKKLTLWISKGLKQYSVFVDNKEAAGIQELREATQKPRISEPLLQSSEVRGIMKQTNSKNMPILAPIPISPLKEEKEVSDEGDSEFILEEEESSKRKEYQLIIQQTDGPQTSFFSVKEQGAKIGRHSSNQILILDESISRYHAEINFQQSAFLLKDIGSTTGTFIKIENRKPIYPKMIIEMGSNQFQANFIGGCLTLTVIEGPAHDLVIEVPKQSKVTIGRKPSNPLNFPDDQHLSNLHSTISYLEGKYFIEDMNTTNGTWQRLSLEGEISELFEIGEKTVFKIGTNQTYVCKVKIGLVSNKSRPNACVICCDSDKDCVYMPCKHNTACIKCSKNLKECPICRVKIQDLVRIYKT